MLWLSELLLYWLDAGIVKVAGKFLMKNIPQVMACTEVQYESGGQKIVLDP